MVWTSSMAAWRGLGVWRSTHNTTPWLDSVSALIFSMVPPAMWCTPHMAATTGNARQIAMIAHERLLHMWRLQVVAGLQAIWRWQHSYRTAATSTTEHAVTASLNHVKLRIVLEALERLDF